MIYSSVLKCPSIVQQGQKPWNYKQSTTGAFEKTKKYIKSICRILEYNIYIKYHKYFFFSALVSSISWKKCN